ncbi:hypothetical protein C8Q77DRAFT_1109962 [Trametes polyzona]|nr:hypothetical protein C8Q77DRAFT_1109962 [Trametes polyzona]
MLALYGHDIPQAGPSRITQTPSPPCDALAALVISPHISTPAVADPIQEHTCIIGAPPIMNLSDDELHMIAAHLQKSACTAADPSGSLARFSLCCRRIRQICLPLLFSRCSLSHIGGAAGVPPFAIRPYVRHIAYRWDLYPLRYVHLCAPPLSICLPFTDLGAADPPRISVETASG